MKTLPFYIAALGATAIGLVHFASGQGSETPETSIKGWKKGIGWGWIWAGTAAGFTMRPIALN